MDYLQKFEKKTLKYVDEKKLCVARKEFEKH